jgi:hypothetical protein
MDSTVWYVEDSFVQECETCQAGFPPSCVVLLSEVVRNEGVMIREDLIVEVDVSYGLPYTPDVPSVMPSVNQNILETCYLGSHDQCIWNYMHGSEDARWDQVLCRYCYLLSDVLVMLSRWIHSRSSIDSVSPDTTFLTIFRPSVARVSYPLLCSASKYAFVT